jgi:hypothetical protein
VLIRLTQTLDDGLVARGSSIAMTRLSVLVSAADSKIIGRVHPGVDVVSVDDRQVQPAVVRNHRLCWSRDVPTSGFWKDKGYCCGGNGGQAEDCREGSSHST